MPLWENGDKMSYYRSGDYVVEISYDECAENPREWGQDETDWHLVCAEHRRYNLPHETHETLSSKELSENPDYDVRPLSFFDHSNIALVEGVRDGWDVCFCGYAWRKRGEYDVELSDVLDVWNTWANGGVMTATLYDLDGNILDSIGGLYEDSERDAMAYVIQGFWRSYAPGFDPDNATEIQPCYTISFH